MPLWSGVGTIPSADRPPQRTTPLLPSQTLVEADALGLHAGDVEVAYDRREMPHDGAADAAALVGGRGRHRIDVDRAQEGPVPGLQPSVVATACPTSR
jgi:hypothetical protein